MGVTSVARALDILEYLSGRNRPTPAAVIRRNCAIPKSSLHHLLHQLKQKRYVAYHPNERGWTLGPRLGELNSEEPLFSQALAVLEAFQSGGSSLNARALVELTGLPTSLLDRTLFELEEYGFLNVQADGSYTLGLELVSLATRIRWIDRYRLASQSILIHLRDATGETANLIVKDGEFALYIEQVESRQPLRYSGWVGRRVPLAETATGAALSAPGAAHVVVGAVDAGATAIACGVPETDPALAVSIIAPTARLEAEGIDRAKSWVEAAARQVAERLSPGART